MTTELIFSSVILLLCTAPLIIIGITQYRSKDPVGFWSGKKPPTREQVTDVPTYNRKHGMMWILLGAGLILCFLCGLPFGGLASACLCMMELFGGILGMIAYHRRLNHLYIKKEGNR